MPTTPSRRRVAASLSAVATTSLALAGLALLSTPTEAAPAPGAAPKSVGYTGAPVNPAPYTLTQPDGDTLRVYRFGDALSNAVATVKGNHTLVEGADGYWRYASGLTASGELKASKVIAGRGRAPQTSTRLAPAPRAATTPPRAPVGGIGTARELVILASFADQEPVGSTPQEWYDKYFGTEDSVADFYDEASGGQFDLVPAETDGALDGVVGWVELDEDHPNTGVTNGPDDYVADAITAASATVDFASFDDDEDGELTTDELHVTVIGAGYETSYSGPENACGPSIWGHQWELAAGGVEAPTVDGVTVGDSGYTTFGEFHCDTSDTTEPEGHMASIGIMAHEFGHDINWPDLYDTRLDTDGIGRWSLMSYGSWGFLPEEGQVPGASPSLPDAWAKYYQGWIDPEEITEATDDVQVPVGGAVLLSPNPGGVDWLFNANPGNGEYFLVENRQLAGYDASLPGCGLLVYRIDENVTPTNGANAGSEDPLVKVIEADGDENLATVEDDDYGSDSDPFPGSDEVSELDDTTTPSTRFHDERASNLDVHVDSTTCATTMQIDVQTPGDASPPVTRPANDAFSAATAITGATGEVAQSTEYATTEAGEPKAAGSGLSSVWLRWTAPASGEVTLTTEGSSYDTALGLYTGSSVAALTEVASNDDEDNANEIYTSKLTTRVTAGTVYSIAADGYGGDWGDLELAWDLEADATPTPTTTPTVTPTPTPTVTATASPTATAVPAPANDLFGSAAKLKGKKGSTSGTTNGAGHEAKEKVFKRKDGATASVWFTWKAKRTGEVTFKATGAFDPLLAVAGGTKLAKLGVLDTSSSPAKVTVDVVRGTTYRIVLDGADASRGAYTLSWK